jgi:phosphopantothenoylcysteine decarboxylase/phosphopantothenate--cysteine ligase
VRIIVTAGPTREYIDDVRFISNPSSGRMGYAVAAEAVRRRHSVVLLAGPTCLEPPKGAEVARFESVGELQSLLRKALPAADCLVMAAAVGDYCPLERIPGKHKKMAAFSLELVQTPDVLASLAPQKSNKIFVGFAVEVKDAVENARQKVRAKALDLLVLNAPDSFGAESADFAFVFPSGQVRPLGVAAKTAVAEAILNEVEALFAGERPAAGR